MRHTCNLGSPLLAETLTMTMFAQVIALSSALQVGVRVVHLDRSAGPLNHHDFPDGQPPSVHLLYRPGHYDLIYA